MSRDNRYITILSFFNGIPDRNHFCRWDVAVADVPRG